MMKSKFNLPITLLTLAAVALTGCGPFGGGPAEKTVYVGPYQVDCVGVAPQKCLLIKEKAQDDWKMFYDHIQGFEYEAGYEYELLVREDKVDNPPADASSIRWTLVELRSKTRSLEGTTWVLNSYLNSEGVLVSALPDSEATARFQQEQVSGNASCNSYFGTYRLEDDKLTVDVGGMTEMYCMPEERMAQEKDFIAALDSAASHLIVENKLQIEDTEGKELLVFSALEPAPLVSTQWQLTGYNNGMGGFVSLLAGSEITAVFAPDGGMGGSAGCNDYTTSYEVAGDRISFGPVASTMMMCADPAVMDQETTYLAALESVVTYNIDGKQLALMDAEGQVVLTYTVREPTPLVGTTWQMTFYNNGKGGFTSAVLGTEVTAVFGEDGSLTGSAGCNRYTAGYETDGDSISIGPPASTRMFCAEPEGTMEQEAAYLAALESAATYAIQGDTLELRNAEGARLASYVAKAETAGPQ
jgi:heat shock protein HslJ